ncbi:unnamed protein product [Caenorhabditis bovis]|uniref:Uncharacterized protein n=1 Tax=Caenorhabditis bovis TaxID=2654633 RepID=A0A8S1ETR7_9PELO|nr:unnamed protein product [Caenorhabditis bovis]
MHLEGQLIPDHGIPHALGLIDGRFSGLYLRYLKYAKSGKTNAIQRMQKDRQKDFLAMPSTSNNEIGQKRLEADQEEEKTAYASISFCVVGEETRPHHQEIAETTMYYSTIGLDEYASLAKEQTRQGEIEEFSAEESPPIEEEQEDEEEEEEKEEGEERESIKTPVDEEQIPSTPISETEKNSEMIVKEEVIDKSYESESPTNSASASTQSSVLPMQSRNLPDENRRNEAWRILVSEQEQKALFAKIDGEYTLV